MNQFPKFRSFHAISSKAVDHDITTSDYSSGAREYVTRISRRIVLVNGSELADLMIEHNVGVVPEESYVIKKVDSAYFDEDQ